MELNAAEQLARRLMKQLLPDPKWTFRFDRAKQRFGQCDYVNHVISLSHRLTLINDEAQVEDTIRHEIAHALAGPKAGHKQAWKEMAVLCGARPHRCAESSAKTLPRNKRLPVKFMLRCKRCGLMFVRKRHTAATRLLMAGQPVKIWHQQCGKYFGQLEFVRSRNE